MVYYSTVSEAHPNANESAAYTSTSNTAALYGVGGGKVPSAYAAPLGVNLPSAALYGGGGRGGRGDNSDGGYGLPAGFPQSNTATMSAIPVVTGGEVVYMATGNPA